MVNKDTLTIRWAQRDGDMPAKLDNLGKVTGLPPSTLAKAGIAAMIDCYERGYDPLACAMMPNEKVKQVQRLKPIADSTGTTVMSLLSMMVTAMEKAKDKGSLALPVEIGQPSIPRARIIALLRELESLL
jgi:hypothetical protein